MAIKRPNRDPTNDFADLVVSGELVPEQDDDPSMEFFDDDDDEDPLDAERRDPNQEFEVDIKVQKRGTLAVLTAHGEAYDGRLEKSETRKELARVTEGELVMTPRVSSPYRDEFLQSKHDTIVRLVIPASSVRDGWSVPTSVRAFDRMIAKLPTGFSRYCRRGLGLRWEYRFIVDAIGQDPAIKEIRFVSGDEARIDGPTFVLGFGRFERLRRAIDTISNRARARALEQKRLLTHNELLSEAASTRHPQRVPEVKPGELYELVKLSAHQSTRTRKDRQAAAELVKADVENLLQDDPVALLELHSEIERVTLGELVERFGALLTRNPAERYWQTFFEQNPFILSIAFPFPVHLIRGQAHVGGMRLDGKGESIADFLYGQKLTGGIAIFEIKTAKTQLLAPNPFRRDLFDAHKELSSAISQVLDQRSELTVNFHSRSKDLPERSHVGHIHCFVIAGRAPVVPDQQRSLDLYRGSLKDVTVVTFDELLEKLQSIHRLMGRADDSAEQPPEALA